MNISRTYLFALFAGLMILPVALGHFLLPTHGYAPSDIQAVPTLQRDHFVYLGTYAIGSFLLAMSGLTLYFALRPPTPEARVFFAVMAAVWVLRVVLEFVFPVDLPIFFLAQPHGVLVVVTGLIAAGYLRASVWRSA